MRWFLHAKIHSAIISDANVDYMGSITIDSALLEKTGIMQWEKVHVWDITNGERVETYVISGEKNSGIICINGAAAKKISKGDIVIIAAFELAEKAKKPKIALVDGKNGFVRYL